MEERENPAHHAGAAVAFAAFGSPGEVGLDTDRDFLTEMINLQALHGKARAPPTSQILGESGFPRFSSSEEKFSRRLHAPSGGGSS
jgi:hypothetical protein